MLGEDEEEKNSIALDTGHGLGESGRDEDYHVVLVHERWLDVHFSN